MKKILLIATLAFLAMPVQAEAKGDAGVHNGGHHKPPAHHVGGHHRRAAPLPLAAGIPALALMGGALALALRKGK